MRFFIMVKIVFIFLFISSSSSAWEVISQSAEGHGNMFYYEIRCENNMVLSLSADLEKEEYFDVEGNIHSTLDDAVNASCTTEYTSDGYL
ncbi:hypothetical protein [Veronia pacifica]|uniref:Lysozyme inhibitor n=1 Tax=Veronia pacifica TaxID=1080227 RepID=A0A1C3EDJ1_9GAMM|nr:hypothetical protein [Veronia pacifica]ODA31316.1 hypothetical protein A8L45_17670 [Veronia pacifica]